MPTERETTAKHTPGPYMREGCTIYALDENGKVNRFSALVQGGWKKQGKRTGERTHENELEATASLLSAAPDMLGIHQDSVEILEIVLEEREAVNGEEDEILRDLIERIKAVLAKATGEAA